MHMIYVACYMSHVAIRMLHVACRMSRVTCRVSRVIYIGTASIVHTFDGAHASCKKKWPF